MEGEKFYRESCNGNSQREGDLKIGSFNIHAFGL